MSALSFAALALVSLQISNTADNAVGRTVLALFAACLFVCGVLVAPWSAVFA